jgi:hypothetical protein
MSDGLVLEEDESGEGAEPPEYPVMGETVAEAGSEWALVNVRRQIREAAGNRSSADAFNHALNTGVPALGLMASELSPTGAAPEDLRTYAAYLAAIVSAGAGGSHPGWIGRGGIEARAGEGWERTSLPLLSGEDSSMTWIRPEVREQLNSAAAVFGGEFLLFADGETLAEIADDRPGKYLGELTTAKETLEGLVFEVKMSTDRLKILKAFFRTA